MDRRHLLVGNERVVVADPVMSRLYDLVERLAPAHMPVLISGETGCGKELVANALHSLSSRVAQRFVSLNCAALHDSLVESELFGHERGAFSGAIASKPGLFEVAEGSTLFLDEIGELTLLNQAKLLRVLESQRVTRLGDTHEREINVRIVAATNRDLRDEVTAGRFRRDLLYRLSGATLYLPPLRDRPNELRLLAEAFLEQACHRARRAVIQIPEEAVAALHAHTWPGNIRELKNLMNYVAATLTDDQFLAAQVAEWLSAGRQVANRRTSDGPAFGAPPLFRPLADELRELETRRIREALVATGGNQTKAAQLLHVPVRTFFEKAKQYGLTPTKKRVARRSSE